MPDNTRQLSRRNFLCTSAALAAAGGCMPQIAWADRFLIEPDRRRTRDADLLTPEAQSAIDNGLEYLAANMQEDGTYGDKWPRHGVAVPSLAGLAFLAAGHTPGRGKFGNHINRALQFVLDHTTESGYITVPGETSHGPMYGHGFAALFLAECYGMSLQPEIHEKLSKCIELIINTQNDLGGWRYQPQRGEADISVTVCQVMALRAARNAGIDVPNETIAASVDYIKNCQNLNGGFMYMAHGGQSAFPRSAAAVVALFNAGEHESPEVQEGLQFLMQHLPKGGFNREDYYFYGHYYAVQAMWHAGGDYWAQWYPAIRDELVNLQRPGGVWNDPLCPEYGTAMACIVLQMPNNYLPIFQR